MAEIAAEPIVEEETILAQTAVEAEAEGMTHVPKEAKAALAKVKAIEKAAAAKKGIVSSSSSDSSSESSSSSATSSSSTSGSSSSFNSSSSSNSSDSASSSTESDDEPVTAAPAPVKAVVPQMPTTKTEKM